MCGPSFIGLMTFFLVRSNQVKLLISECQTSGMYAKRPKQATTKRQYRGLLVFSLLPGLNSAGSRSVCFHTSLGLQVEVAHTGFSGLIRLFKKCEDGRSNSDLFANKRSKAFSRRLLKSSGREECKHRCPKLADSTNRRTTSSKHVKKRGAPFPNRKPLRGENGREHLT
jgi:hypothetical protein